MSQRERVVDSACAEQELPAPGLRRYGDEREHGREREPAQAGRADDVRRLAEVDLRDEVGDRKTGDEERREDAEPALPQHDSDHRLGICGEEAYALDRLPGPGKRLRGRGAGGEHGARPVGGTPGRREDVAGPAIEPRRDDPV